MLPIESIVDEVRDDDRDERPAEALAGIMVHRVGVDLQTGVVLGYDARSICDAFLGRVPKWAEVARATGGENAYSLLIGGDLGPGDLDGQVWQALPLDEIGWHGRRFSAPYLGIACIGDFREQAPSPLQLGNLISLCGDLCLALDLGVGRVVGHGEVPGAHDGSKAPGQPAACPGDLLDMDRLRGAIADDMEIAGRAGAVNRLSVAGLRFP